MVKQFRCKLKTLEEARKIYKEAQSQSQTSVISKNRRGSLLEFVIGSLQPGQICQLCFQLSLNLEISNSNSAFVKLPLKLCNQFQNRIELQDYLSGNFSLSLFVEQVQPISVVRSNCEGVWNPSLSLFELKQVPNRSSILLITDFVEQIKSVSIAVQRLLFTTLCPQLPDDQGVSSDFIFLVDCSGSMSGSRIRQARESLQLFLRSLPYGCYFDIIRFGTTFESVFDKLVEYNDTNLVKALEVASTIQADLNGTNLLNPLLSIFEHPIRENRVCQIFLISDGDVENRKDVFASVVTNKHNYRIFSVGISCNEGIGLINGLAKLSGGSPIFLNQSSKLSEVIIEQLSYALSSSLTQIQFHFEGVDEFETTPFPVPPIINKTSLSIISKLPTNIKGEKFLCNYNFGNSTFDLMLPIFYSGFVQVAEIFCSFCFQFD